MKQAKHFTDADVDRIIGATALATNAGLQLRHYREAGQFRWKLYDGARFVTGFDVLLHLEIFLAGYTAAQSAAAI